MVISINTKDITTAINDTFRVEVAQVPKEVTDMLPEGLLNEAVLSRAIFASDCEKTSIEQAKQIVDLSGKIIDVYKVQLEGVSLAVKMDNIASAKSIVTSLGIVEEQSLKQLE